MKENNNSGASRTKQHDRSDDVIVEEICIIFDDAMLAHNDFEGKKCVSDLRGAEWKEDQTDERLVIYLRALRRTDQAIGMYTALSNLATEMMHRDIERDER